MTRKTRKTLSGLSLAGLVAGSSIPLMGEPTNADNKKPASTKKSEVQKKGASVKDNAAPKKCAAKPNSTTKSQKQ